MALPLSGIRVLEICQVFAGPMAGMLLADQGADVIKIEPLDGDSSRPAVPYLPEVEGMGIRYVTFNRNKRSIAMDIGKPKGREVVYDLLRRADIMVINMRVGARQRAGLNYEHVAAVNRRVIYAAITGYGEYGPDADLPGADVRIQPRSGDLDARRTTYGVLPPNTQLYHFDMSAPMLLVYGVMLALRQREITGVGQKVDTSLLQAALACQSVNMTRRAGSNGNYGIVPAAPITYRCGDGRYIHAQTGGAQWEGICHTLGLDHLLKDTAYDTAAKRTQKADELHQILSAHFGTKPAVHWEALLKADGHTVSMVKEISEVYEDPQVVANGMFTQFEQPGLGTVTAVNVPFQMSATANEPHLRSPAPTLGQHTLEVLKELGRSPEDVRALRAQGVIP
ncbi:MAG: CoA transferase [Dehalococcoidia bacterium]|nr:CoA transferase [Dehalococcoidia bacterium]